MSNYHFSPASLDGLLRHLEHGCGTCRRKRVRRTLGDRVLLSNGNEVAISGIQSYNVEATKVYNLEVEDNHTYFVGEDGVLVHNYVIETGEVEKGDTISKIRIALNKKYGTNYSDEDIILMNGIIDKNKIYEDMRISSPQSFEKYSEENKANYFNSTSIGRYADEYYLGIITGGGSIATPLVDLNAETGFYTVYKRRGEFESRTTNFGFEAAVYSRELGVNLGIAPSANFGIFRGTIDDYNNSTILSGFINGDGGSVYYDDKGEFRGYKFSIAPSTGLGIKIPDINVTKNTNLSTGSSTNTLARIAQAYYYAPPPKFTNSNKKRQKNYKIGN